MRLEQGRAVSRDLPWCGGEEDASQPSGFPARGRKLDVKTRVPALKMKQLDRETRASSKFDLDAFLIVLKLKENLLFDPKQNYVFFGQPAEKINCVASVSPSSLAKSASTALCSMRLHQPELSLGAEELTRTGELSRLL